MTNEENFILEYFGMKESETDEKTKISTDFGDLVNLLSMFSEKTNHEMDILQEFVNWVRKNYYYTKGGYIHRGDFYRNDKPVKLESLKNQFLNENNSKK